jgi:hypothetical protein
VVALCPINPFWWPVKPDVLKGAAKLFTGAYSEAHYSSVYFHNAGAEVDERQAAYLDAWATGWREFAAGRDVFPVVIGMEALDRAACEGLSERLGRVPVLVSDDHDMYTLVSVLRRCSALLSSRYHAIVCSMPARVPSAGITMDERIRNLMIDRGTPELALEVDDPGLGPRVAATLARLVDDGPGLADGIGACVVDNLERMGRMGQVFVEHLRSRHPEFPLRDGLGLDGDSFDHLPSLSRDAEALL